jgi:signal transduction histidine kinase
MAWQSRQRGLFWRFLATFGVIALLLIGGMALTAYLITRFAGGETAVLVTLGGCSVALALPVSAAIIGARASRSITGPLADLLVAAEAVGKGDLSVRIPEESRGQFNVLAITFNKMLSDLQQIDEQRRSMTADIAHELRTPLHIIQGNLEGILDGVYQPTPEHIKNLLDETHRLARLIEDLRTLSLAESGGLALKQEPLAAADLLADVATSFGGLAQQAGITLAVESSTLEGVMIDGDAVRLNQVLTNLVANAIRYTPSGGLVTLIGKKAPDKVQLIIRDSGRGIPPEDLPHIFDRFWKADPSRASSDGSGAGLGLAIARQLVTLHGGTIEAESEVGRGTTFTIELPAI